MEVKDATEIVLQSTSTNIKCKGNADGTAGISATGGTAPYTYLWSNNATTPSIANLVAGTYSVKVTDANGCSKNSNVNISEPQTLTFAFNKNDVLCNGGNNGKIDILPQGGVQPYQLRYNGSSSSSLSLNQLNAGSYTISILDNNNCITTNTILINQPEPVTISFVSEVLPIGFQTKDGKIVIDITGGNITKNNKYATTWSFSGVSLINDKQVFDGKKVTNTLENIEGGIYSLMVVDDNGCKKDFSYTLQQGNKFSITTAVDKQVSCQGKSDGTLSAKIVGANPATNPTAYKYAWFKKTQNGLQDLLVNLATLSNVSTGSYVIKITDANAFTASSEINLTALSNIQSKVTLLQNPACPNTKDGVIQIETIGAVEPVTVSWGQNLSGLRISGLGSGNYFGVITDKNGCSGEAAVELKAKDDIKISVINKTQPSCSDKCDGTLEISVLGQASNYSVLWSNTKTFAKIDQLCAGNYSVKVSGTNGCGASLNNIVLNAPAAYQVEVSNDVNICIGSTVELDASQNNAGTGFRWTLPNGSTSLIPKISIKNEGKYKIQVTNQVGCVGTDEFTVRVVSVTNTLNFALASTGAVGEPIYVINLSPASINSVWKVTGNADIIQNERDILVLNPKTKGEIKIELSAKLGTCDASLTKIINIQNAVQRNTPAIDGITAIEDLFLVYPNPTSGSFDVVSDVSLTGQIKVSVLDASFSKVLYTETYDNSTTNKVKVNLQEIGNAIVYVVIEAANKKIIKRVFVYN